MQKKLIALAVAGLASSAAFAQSNVTVYGVADVYVGSATADGNARKSVVNSSGLSGSRIGFKGTEDLGNGLKALFTLEYGLSVDDNTGVGATNNSAGTLTGNARQQFVGLTGGFGTALAGRLQTAGYDFVAATNVFHGTAINPLDTVTKSFAGGYGVATVAQGGLALPVTTLINSSSRANNAVAYVSPSFGGFTVAYNHARLSETASNGAAGTSDGNANLLSATYKNGPATAGLIVTNISSANTANGVAHVSEWALGGAYDFGVLALKGSYQEQKVDNILDGKDKAWQLGVIVPVTSAGKVLVGYAKSTVNSIDTKSLDTKSWTLAYTHSLSKRTTLYTGYQRVDNESDGVVGTGLQSPLAAGGAVAGTVITNTAGAGGGNASAFVAGINHSF